MEDEIAEQEFILKGDPTKKEALKVRDRLSLLIREYPHIPNLYNLRYHATRLIDRLGKFRNEVESTLERFADYFFAKLDLIDAMIEAGETPNLGDFFGEARNLSAIFPNRKEFHQSEVTKFFTVMIKYHLHVKESALAFAYYQEFFSTGLEDNLPRELTFKLMAACSLEVAAVLGLVANDADFRESFFEILLEKEEDEDE